MKKSHLPGKVRKRDGSLVPFDRNKIENAILRAAFEVLRQSDRAAFVAGTAGDIVLKDLSRRPGATLGVEDIQDAVEKGLMKAGFPEIAKSYILYRERRAEIRTAKKALGLRDDLKLSINALEVLKKRYLLRDDRRSITETPGELFRRVARHVARAEEAFGPAGEAREAEEVFFGMMRDLEFIPNSPTLMNAGTPLGQLSACFVIPVPDSIDGIFDALKDMAKIHKSGGGTGFSFSRLRPAGDLVSSTKGEASGPVSFMSIFDEATGVIVQGGRRRGANMGILRCDHPDIVDFVEAKTEPGRFSNFNLSVGVTDRFMRAVLSDGAFDLVNPRTGRKVRSLKARALFDLIANAAWRTGDPGLVFLDEINRKNPTPGLGPIEATNPCGELPLLPFESCNLGSINLERMVAGGRVDWQKLSDRIAWGVRFLDDVIEVNRHPLPEIGEITLANRKIGLGVMGFADMLIRLGIPYDTDEAVRFAGRLMRFVRSESLKASCGLAKRRGVFPNFGESVYAKKNLRVRNATVNTIAPTGTISIIAGCSSGIEPLFAVSFVRNVLSGAKLFETNPVFEEMARNRGFLTPALSAEIARAGSIRNIGAIPEDLRRLFVTAFDVPPEYHLRIQGAFQRHTDNSVSKTINLPADATAEEVRNIYLEASRLRCKGITVYRYGSKGDQVLSLSGPLEGRGGPGSEFVSAEPDYSGGCAAGSCTF